MASPTRQRITLSVNGDIYKRVQDALKQHPEPYSVSRLVDELFMDWLGPAELGPQLRDESDPEKRLALMNQQAVHDFLALAGEIEQTLRIVQQKGVG